MAALPIFRRPTFAEALGAWKTALADRGFPVELAWVFDENLCFEDAPQRPGGFKLGYQTRFSPIPPGAEQIAYEHFSDFQARIVFYRLGSSSGKSVCLLLCDDWFESRGEQDGYLRRDEWLMSFRPGEKEQVEEITDEGRWKQRIMRNRPLNDLDFCMTLQAVHETLAHGRVLTPYEHYSLKFLDAWRRLLTRTE